MKRFLFLLLSILLLLPATASAVTQDELMQKIQDLTRQLDELKKQMDDLQNQQMTQQADVQEAKEASKKFSWLTIGGDYRFRYDYLKGTVNPHFNFAGFENGLYEHFQNQVMFGNVMPVALPNGINTVGVPIDMNTLMAIQGAAAVQDEYTVKNKSLFLNRFRLNLKAQVTENIAVKARLAMYKIWGHQTSDPVTGNGYFADRITPDGAPFDGQVGHVPLNNTLYVDYAYATWSNIFDLPVWFSVGRRPSTNGIPGNYRQNEAKSGTSGVPSFLVNYAFDGLTIGAAPDIEFLPGFYAKLCYGKGFDGGYESDLPGDNTPDDVNFIGLNVVPIDTDTFHVEFQWNRAFDIFDTFPDSGVKANLGDIDQLGALVTYKIEDLGPGDLNLFGAAALSKTHPSSEVLRMDILQPVDTNGDMIPDTVVMIQNAPMAGLLYDIDPNTGMPVDDSSHTGHHFYLGARYDIKKTNTKIGLEYNYGSKNWVTFGPASDDMWTNKLGTRGNVYEAYIIQELPEIPVAKLGKAYLRLGYQYYDFNYTGSNSWIGAPQKISDLTAESAQFLTPLKKAQDIYFTFDVRF